MSIVVRFAPAGLTAAQYDKTVEALGASGPWPPDGLEFHVCFGSDGDLRVSEVWESPEKFAAFGERLMPILAAAGVELSAPPEVLEVHNTVTG